MKQLRRWLIFGGVAWAFGCSGWTCSHAMHNHEIDDEFDALGWLVFVVLFGGSAAIGGYFLDYSHAKLDRSA
jgi:hypothetical protein